MDLQILQSMPDAVVVSDQRGSIRYANEATQKLFGYEPAELIGVPIDVLLPARFRPAHAMHRSSYLTSPRVRPMALGRDLTALKKTGEEFPVDISLAPLQVGPETYVIASIRDISERRQFEEQQRQLRRAKEEIQHRDEVLAIASHELRSPVGSMQLQVATLRRAASATASELSAMRERMGNAASELDALREHTAGVERQARRLARLVEQLLDSSQVVYGQLGLKLEDTDLSSLTRDAVAALREEVERSGSTLTVRAAEPVRGRWDPVRIEQVIANLLLNAAKFGRGKPITVSVEADRDRASVTVEDQGVGISTEDQLRIFERFERAPVAGGVIGLGLGLYIARQIVHAHGGAILLRSSVGSGSTFTVELPRLPMSRD